MLYAISKYKRDYLRSYINTSRVIRVIVKRSILFGKIIAVLSVPYNRDKIGATTESTTSYTRHTTWNSNRREPRAITESKISYTRYTITNSDRS